MEIKEKQQKEVEIIKDVFCDCCGKSCLVNGMPEYMSLKSIWGYGTNKDMEKWTAQVCESCVNEKFSFIKFKIEEVVPQTTYSTKSEYQEAIDKFILPYPIQPEHDNN